MNMLVKPQVTPIEVPNPKEDDEVLHTLPDSSNDIFRVFGDKPYKNTENGSRQDEKGPSKMKVKINDKKVTVHLSGEINIDSVKNRMKEHMEAYPETAAGFYARFIDHTEEDIGYIVLPCDKNKSNSIDINGLYYKIYPFGDHSNKFVNILAKELADALNGDMSEEKATETINEKIIDVIKISPLDAKGIKKFKNELVDFLLQDPKLLNTFGDKKYLIYNYINNAFSNIEDYNKRY